MIICVGLAADDTFIHTLLALKRAGIVFHAIDIAQLVYSGQIEMPFDNPSAASILLHGKEHKLSAYDGAWVRLIDISSGAPNEQMQQRAQAFFRSLSILFNWDIFRVINPPRQEVSNFTKLVHAIELSSIGGWCIPRSCLTSNPSQARDFIASCPEGVIFKGASGVKTWATLYESDKHEIRLPLISNCPVLFQERIVGPDVRVHAVGDRHFAEMIESSELDYRAVRGNKYIQTILPDDIASGCRKLTTRLGVPFMGIDFKIQQSTGDWFFLEANSLPCYQGYDRRCGGRISRALVSWLTNE